MEKHPISTSAGTVSNVTIPDRFSEAPSAEVVWAVSNENEYGRTDAVVRYRILGISEESNFEYSLIGSKYVYDKFDELETKYVDSEETCCSPHCQQMARVFFK